MTTDLFSLPEGELRVLERLADGFSAVYLRRQNPLFVTDAYVVLAGDEVIHLKVEGKTFDWKFECFRIAAKVESNFKAVDDESIEGWGKCSIRLLFRREFQEVTDETAPVTVGQIPVIQRMAHPSEPYPSENRSVLVAGGILLSSVGDTALACVADDFPLALRILRDSREIREIADSYAVASIADVQKGLLANFLSSYKGSALH